MPLEDPRWDDWIEAIEREGVNLTVWETDFIESIRLQREAGRLLSPAQAEVLERIYATRTT